MRAAGGQLLGSAYMEPRSLICARLYAPGEDRALDRELIGARLADALATRDLAFDRPCYRLVYGDSDGLPGVVVDRFGDYLVLQLNNAAIERFREPLLAALVELLQPSGVLLRTDSRERRAQALPQAAQVVHGEVPERVALEENGVRFLAPVHGGQKTGWFYDHRLSRARLASYTADAEVLDVYSYIGGWGIQAAARGARSVCCVDSSGPALSGVMENARLNGLEGRVSTHQGGATEVMAQFAAEGRSFDLVILDPPAFIQRRKDLKKGIAAYRRIFEAGLRLTRPGGVLVAGSCSMHLSRADLVFALQGAALRAGCRLRILEQGGQGPDHPVHPAIPETEYLKAVFVRKTPA